MSLDAFLRRLVAGWWLLGVCVLAGALTSVFVALTVPPTFEATSVVVLRSTVEPHGIATTEAARYAAARAGDYRSLAHRRSVLTEVIASEHLTVTPRQLRERVDATTPLDAAVLLVRARSTDASEAARVSTTLAHALSSAIVREETLGPFHPSPIDAPVAVEAPVPDTPVAPRPALLLAAGILAGAAVGSVLAVVGAASLSPGRRAAARHLVPNLALAAPLGAPRTRPTRAGSIGLHAAAAMLVAAAVPWRPDTYYEGGIDPVVLAKAALAVGGLALAWLLGRGHPVGRRVPALPVVMIAAYLAVTVVGGLANETLVPAIVVASRVAILASALTMLVGRFGAVEAMRSLIHVVAVVAGSAALTGLASYAGRLGGLIPPLHPNALAAGAALLVIWLMGRLFSGRDTFADALWIAVCTGVIVLTASRTTLIALLVACLMMLPRSTGLRRRTALLGTVLLPVLFWFVVGTDVLTSIADRGGAESVTSFSNRRVAWEAVFTLQRDGWQLWFGQGLSQKHVGVTGQWWDAQLLDSSWISAWVQGGMLGLATVAILAVVTVGRAAFRPRVEGAAWLGLATVTCLTAFLESGLFDASVPFLAFFVVSLAVNASVEPHPSTARTRDRLAVPVGTGRPSS